MSFVRPHPTGSAEPASPAKAETTPRDGAISVEWITDARRMDGLAEAWTTLEDSVQRRTVVSTFDYLQAWYRHYGGDFGGDPLIGLARRRGKLVGVAPLVIRKGRIGRIPVTRVDFAAHDAHAGEFLIRDDHPGILASLIESLAAEVKFDMVCLNGLERGSESFQTLVEAASRHLQVEFTDHPYARVDLSGGYEAYCSSMRHNFRRNLKRQARRVAAAGQPEVEGIEGPTVDTNTVEACIARLIAITEASYKLQGRRLADLHRNFLGDLVRRFAPRGMASLSFLTIAGQDAAVVLGLVERKSWHDITLAYAQAYAELSPGAYLMQEVLKRLARGGVHTVISRGAHDYKRRWATEFVSSTRVFMFSPNLRGSAARLVRFSLNSLWARLGLPVP